jgi:hypothetical protein
MVEAGTAGRTSVGATWQLCRAFATLARAEPNMNGGILL